MYNIVLTCMRIRYTPSEKKLTSGVTRELTQAHTRLCIFKDRPRKSRVRAHLADDK